MFASSPALCSVCELPPAGPTCDNSGYSDCRVCLFKVSVNTFTKSSNSLKQSFLLFQKPKTIFVALETTFKNVLIALC